MYGWLVIGADGEIAVFLREESAQKWADDTDGTILGKIKIFQRYRATKYVGVDEN